MQQLRHYWLVYNLLFIIKKHPMNTDQINIKLIYKMKNFHLYILFFLLFCLFLIFVDCVFFLSNSEFWVINNLIWNCKSWWGWMWLACLWMSFIYFWLCFWFFALIIFFALWYFIYDFFTYLVKINYTNDIICNIFIIYKFLFYGFIIFVIYFVIKNPDYIFAFVH